MEAIVISKGSNTPRPETLAQARTFDRVVALAVEHGLCHRCAAAIAWGHQNGFATLHPPCSSASCAAALRRLPVSKPNGWRTVAGSASDRRSWAALNVVTGPGGARTPGDALVDTDRAHRTGHRISRVTGEV